MENREIGRRPKRLEMGIHKTGATPRNKICIIEKALRCLEIHARLNAHRLVVSACKMERAFTCTPVKYDVCWIVICSFSAKISYARIIPAAMNVAIIALNATRHRLACFYGLKVNIHNNSQYTQQIRSSLPSSWANSKDRLGSWKELGSSSMFRDVAR